MTQEARVRVPAGDKEDPPSVPSTDTSSRDVIGKFGVGFYSAFMVSDRVDFLERRRRRRA